MFPPVNALLPAEYPPKNGKGEEPEGMSSKSGGLSELSSAKKNKLSEFLSWKITGDLKKSDATNLTEYRIDVGEHTSIKQRYYPVSPKIQEIIYAKVDKC